MTSNSKSKRRNWVTMRLRFGRYRIKSSAEETAVKVTPSNDANVIPFFTFRQSV